MYKQYRQEFQAIEQRKKTGKVKARWQRLMERFRWYEAKAAEPGIICVGIDIGNVTSGYAYSFHRDHVINPEKIKAPTWVQDGRVSFKTLSSVLMDEELVPVNCGYGAEDSYLNNGEDGNQKTYYLFRNFKSKAMEQLAGNTSPEVDDVTGTKKCPAVKLFAYAIKYFRNHFMDELKVPFKINPEDIFIVLTIPSNTPEVRNFYREAAKEAGVSDNQILMVTEAEAVVRYYKVRADLLNPEVKALTRAALVLDVGGLDVHCAVYRKQPDGSLEQIYTGTLPGLGCLGVVNAFKVLLEKIYRVATSDDHFQLDLPTMLPDIENTLSSLHEKSKVTMRIPQQIYDVLKSQIPDFAGTEFEGEVRFSKDRIRLSRKIVDAALSEVLNNTTDGVNDIFSLGHDFDAQVVLLAGGISNLTFYQNYVRSAFPGKTICVSEQSPVLVLNGSLTFGHETKSDIPLKW